MLLIVACAIPILIVLVRSCRGSSRLYQTQLLTYGPDRLRSRRSGSICCSATRDCLSFGHSAYFGMGAYSVAFMRARPAASHSMELYILVGLLITAVMSALFGYVCVRHTRIFFGILTLALSQVLWSLAFKFFWVTGGTDGLRVAAPHHAARRADRLHGPRRLPEASSMPTTTTCWPCSRSAASLMWVIVHSPFGKALQAIRDNETRAALPRISAIRALPLDRVRHFRAASPGSPASCGCRSTA